jgi:hypothetical protein
VVSPDFEAMESGNTNIRVDGVATRSEPTAFEGAPTPLKFICVYGTFYPVWRGVKVRENAKISTNRRSRDSIPSDVEANFSLYSILLINLEPPVHSVLVCLFKVWIGLGQQRGKDSRNLSWLAPRT